jgi:predicted nucleic acid-binding protein
MRMVAVLLGGIDFSALETFRQRPKLGFSDCLLAELARKSGHLPFGTFDRNLGKVAGAEKL